MDRETVQAKALRLLNRRPHSKEELRGKLTDKLPSAVWEYIPEVLTQLESLGYLNDARFCEAYVHHAIEFGKKGSFRIRRELQTKKVDPTLIEEELGKHTEEEKAKCKELAEKKLSALQKKYEERHIIKGHLLRYLANRGFPSHLSIDIVDSLHST